MLLSSKGVSDCEDIAKKIIPLLKNFNIVCFYGEMGAGKTTIIQSVAKFLGVEGRVLSPTFILLRRHRILNKGFFYHADLYRLNGVDEVGTLGIEEIWQNPNNLVMIEWPEIIENLLPQPRLEVRIKKISENEREITINELT